MSICQNGLFGEMINHHIAFFFFTILINKYLVCGLEHFLFSPNSWDDDPI